MVTETLESMVTLPDGTSVDVSHFEEYKGYHDVYLKAKECYPLLTGSLEEFLKEKLGADWANIIHMEDLLHKELLIKDKNDKIDFYSEDPNYSLKFIGRENDSYVFDVKSYGGMRGVFDVCFLEGNYRFKIKPVISIVETEYFTDHILKPREYIKII